MIVGFIIRTLSMIFWSGFEAIIREWVGQASKLK